MILTILTIIIYIVVFLLVAKKIENAIYIALIDSLLPIRFYSILYGIPFSIIFLASILFALGIIKPKIFLKRDWFVNLLIILSLYYLVSNWSYFRHFDYTILNNLILLFVIQNIIINSNGLKVWYNLHKIAVLSGFLLLADVALLNIDIFGNPRQLGFYLIICLIFCMSGRILNPKYKMFSNYVIIIYSLGIVFTFGRLNLAIATIILLVYYTFKTKPNLTKTTFLVLFSVLIIGGFINIVGTKYFTRDIKSIDNIKLSIDDRNLGAFSSGRSVIYFNLWEMFIDNPIFGNGYKSFNDKNNKYNTIEAYGAEQKISAHSVFLQYLSETGIVGFLIYYIFLFSLVSFKFKTKNKYLRKDIFLLSYKFILRFLALAMILGSLLDNHGIHYKHLFIVLAFMFFMKSYLRFIEKNNTPIFKIV